MNTGESVEAVLDTNVLVSAALTDGPPYEILSLAENEELVSVTSPAIVGELRDVLVRDRLPFSDEQVDELAGTILSISRAVEPELDLKVVDCLVSGDSHLLGLDAYGSIDVYSPAEFLERVER